MDTYDHDDAEWHDARHWQAMMVEGVLVFLAVAIIGAAFIWLT